MKKIRINLFIICLLGVLAEVCAQESTWREMPYFLKGYEKQYKKSPMKTKNTPVQAKSSSSQQMLRQYGTSVLKH